MSVNSSHIESGSGGAAWSREATFIERAPAVAVYLALGQAVYDGALVEPVVPGVEVRLGRNRRLLGR